MALAVPLRGAGRRRGLGAASSNWSQI